MSFCKLRMKSMHYFTSYCGETISLPYILPQQQKLGQKRAVTWPKFCKWLPVSNLTCILQWYKLLQTPNEINTSLQKLLSRNRAVSTQQQKLSQRRARTQPKFCGWLPIITWPIFYNDICFCKLPMKSMHPCRSYWGANDNTTTKTKSN